MKILVLSNITKEEKHSILSHFPSETFCFMSSKEATQQDIDEADIIIGNPSPKLKINNPNLQLLQLNSAGSDYYVKEGVLHPNTTLANASGSYGKAIAEHTIGMILALNKNLPFYVKNMEQKQWLGHHGGKELYHSTIAIIGLGDLGYALAKRLKAFDTHIIGVKRTPSTLPKYIDELYTIDALDSILPKADYVILCLPQTKDTIHLFNKERLLRMKKDAMLVNVGRGSAIVTDDLISVLQKKHLYGVALDVTEKEPLPQEHPLWNFENVLLTPHVSGGFNWNSVRQYFVPLVIRNLKHHFKQEALENSVDFTTGYRTHNTALK